MAKIGIDLDGVVADFGTAFQELGEELLGRPLKFPSEWELTSMGVTREELRSMWKRASGIANFWTGLERLDGTDRLGEWLNLQHNLYFITARRETAGYPVHVQSAVWLASQFEITFPRVIEAKEKGPIVRALGIEMFIDDSPEVCENILREAPDCKVYIKDSPYNQSYNGKAERIKNLDAFLRKVNQG